MTAPGSGRARRDPLLRLAARVVAAPYRAEVVADLVDDHQRRIAQGRPAWRSRLRLYADIVQSGLDSRRQRVGPPPTGKRWTGALTDVRVAWRQARARPALTLATLTTIALAVALNAALFGAIRGSLLRPLPFPDPARLVFLWNTGTGGTRDPFAPARALDVAGRATTLDGVALIGHLTMTVTARGPAERWPGQSVSDGFFDVLGVPPAAGRVFHRGESTRDLVVLSDAAWRRHFAADPSAVGRAIVMNGRPRTIAGVMAPSFPWRNIVGGPSAFESPEFWSLADATNVPERPLSTEIDIRTDRNLGFLRVVGRLAPGVTRGQLDADLQRIAGQLGREYPSTDSGRSLVVVSLRDQFFGDVRQPLLLLLAATLLVLVAAVANLAGLGIARLTDRAPEFAIRAALGGSPARLARLLFAESLGISVIGGVLGVCLSVGARGVIARILPASLGDLQVDVTDATVLGGSMLAALFVGAALGIVPWLQLTRSDRTRHLRSQRGVTRSGHLRESLIVLEVATAVVLLTGTALCLESLARLRAVDVGFDPRRLATFDLALPANRADTQLVRTARYRALLDALRAVPGVQSAAFAVTLPIGGDDFGARAFPEGRPLPSPGEERRNGYQVVSEGWFRTLGMRVLDGRDFTPADDGTRGHVVIVNARFAALEWPSDRAVGRRIRLGRRDDSPWLTVVGVVSDIRHGGPRVPPRPEIYEPLYQTSFSFTAVAVRTVGDPSAMAGSLRAAVARIETDLPLGGFRTMEEHLARAYGDQQAISILTTIFGVFAMVLSAAGVYGAVGYSVARRWREFGIRAALGATRGELWRRVLGEGLAPVVAGLVLGVMAAVLLARGATSLLFDTAPTEPAAFSAATTALLVAAVLAVLPAARRAARIDPATALRTD